MAQNTVDYSNNPTGPQLLDDYLAKDQENHLTCNSGIQRPSYARPGTIWINTAFTGTLRLMLYTGDGDVFLGSANINQNVFSAAITNVVTLTGMQTISGTKIFSSPLTLQNGLYVQYGSLNAEDASIVLVPTVDTNTNDTNAASTAWVNNFAVMKSGNETISGVKTLTYQFFRKMEELDVTTAPLSDQYIDWISPVDKNGVSAGFFGTAYYTDEKLCSRLGVTRYVNGQPIYTEVSASIRKDGTKSSYAPASDINGSIVTTEAMFKADGVDDSQNNYVKFGNGLLIQWGHIQQNSHQLNVTFPIPFKNKAYRMFTQDADQLNGYSYAGVTGVTRTTTGATLYSYYANRYYDWLAIGFWY